MVCFACEGEESTRSLLCKLCNYLMIAIKIGQNKL